MEYQLEYSSSDALLENNNVMLEDEGLGHGPVLLPSWSLKKSYRFAHELIISDDDESELENINSIP